MVNALLASSNTCPVVRRAYLSTECLFSIFQAPTLAFPRSCHAFAMHDAWANQAVDPCHTLVRYSLSQVPLPHHIAYSETILFNLSLILPKGHMELPLGPTNVWDLELSNLVPSNLRDPQDDSRGPVDLWPSFLTWSTKIVDQSTNHANLPRT
jgi:hypothetical protein